MAPRAESSEPPDPPGEATQFLQALTRGEEGASDRLFQMVYAELRRLADACLRGERVEHTLQPTALVHEAWLKLVDQSRVEWQGRAHFLGIAAIAMRRILVDHARAKQRDKRGGGRGREPLNSAIQDPAGEVQTDLDLLLLDEGLNELEKQSSRAAKVVQLRFFAGLTEEEVAQTLGVARPTVTRDWRAARAWLSDWMAKRRG